MTPKRFHTHSMGPDEAALRAAFLQCSALMQQRNGATMGLAVHNKSNLDGVVRTVFGDSVVKVLDRDNKLDLKGITIHLLTEKIQLRKLEGPVVAAFVDPHKLDKIVSSVGVTDIVLVPWAAEELPIYLAAHPSSQEIFRSPPLDGSVADGA
ncbi:MAG: hypothetical protein K2X51_06455 [Burkholderiales bacterium]|uniref:hypothetical protein n=1 Tax=Polaromonas sp. TaxID=1869339 RepID=UPI0024881451|nr:hypothetical protein [Polaromonas sp.]MBX9611248.1 hypothetical protein [Burkholderiales bacterium]MDI1339545.1 hypothetical protein [Polaromonas sp.]